MSEQLKTSTFNLDKANKIISIQHFEKNEIIQEFIEQLDDKEMKTLIIAYEHLGSSFDLEKSILFKKWKNTI
jgi:hypothetical protein